MFKDIGDKIYNKLVTLKTTTKLNEVYNYYPKQLDSLPCAIVYPAESDETILDSIDNTITIPFIVTVVDEYDNPSSIEDKLRTLVDDIIDAFRKDQELRNGGTRSCYTLSIGTNWSFITDEANYRQVDIILKYKTLNDVL